MKGWRARPRDHRKHLLHMFALGAVLCAATALRVVHLMSTSQNDPYFYDPAVDPAIYLSFAKAVVEGHAPSVVYFLSPGYPMFLAGLVALFGDDLFTLRAIHAALGLFGVVLVYLLGRKAVGPRVGLIGAAIATGYAPLVFYEQEFLPAAIQGPLTVLGCLTLLEAKATRRLWMYGLGGVFMGLASAARPNMLLASGLIIIWIGQQAVRRKEKTRQSFGAAVAFVLGCALPIAPIAWHNLQAGDVVLISSQGGHNFYIGNGPDATGRFVVPRLFAPDQADDPREQEEVFAAYAEHVEGRELRPSEVSRFYYGLAFDHIREDPASWVVFLGRKLLLFINDYEASSSRDFDSSRPFSSALSLPLFTAAGLMPLALVGIVLCLRRRPCAPILLVLIAHVASALAFFTLSHYRIPAVPLLCVVAALAVDEGLEAMKAKAWKRLLVGAAVLAVSVPVVRLDLDDPQASRFMVLYNLGNRFRNQGKLEQAAQLYEESLSLRPQYLPARNNLALCFEGLPGRAPDAVEQWKILLEAGQQRADALYIDRARRHLLVLEQAAPREEPSREDR